MKEANLKQMFIAKIDLGRSFDLIFLNLVAQLFL